MFCQRCSAKLDDGYADAAKAIYRCAIAVGLVFVPYVFAFVAD